jgi:hypothetical protein
MKRWVIILGLFLVSSSSSDVRYDQLLSKEDFEFQHTDNEKGMALASDPRSEQSWESYNQWLCFSTKNVELECADYDYGTLVPSIRIEVRNRVFLFDTHVEDRFDCEQTLSIWSHLASGGGEVCIFAAHMPDVELGLDQNKPQSLWYINRLKGVGGYWNMYESSPEFIEN